MLLTDSEKYKYKRLLDVTSTLYDPQELSEIAQNKTILDREVGVCPTVLEKFRKSNFAKEVIPGCVESCSRNSCYCEKVEPFGTQNRSLMPISKNNHIKEPFTLQTTTNFRVIYQMLPRCFWFRLELASRFIFLHSNKRKENSFAIVLSFY